MKQQVLQEGQERAARNHQWRLQISKIQTTTSKFLLPPTPILLFGLKSPSNLHRALLDLGADTNVIPLVVYNTLKNKSAIDTADVLYSFEDTPVTSHGVTTLLMHYQGVTTTMSFQIVDCGSDAQLILGKPWIYNHACIIDYANLSINFTIGSSQFAISMMKANTLRINLLWVFSTIKASTKTTTQTSLILTF